MNDLTFGGGSIQITKDLGSPNAVQGFVTEEITQGPKLNTSLPSTFIFQAFDGSAQIFGGSKVWLKVSGVWKQVIVWIKIGGTWKQSTMKLKIGSEWK